MSLSPFVRLLLAIWICVAVSLLLARSWQGDVRLVPIAMLGFVWLMTIGGFHLEASKAERALLRIFDATLWRPENSAEIELKTINAADILTARCNLRAAPPDKRQ